jgi:hypothetical protein
MHTVVTLAEVRAIDTRRGNVRYVSKDTDGNEYTTFREDIGERARQLQGKRVRVEYHEEQRGQYTNVYLDKIDPAEPAAAPGPDSDPQQAAWQTAVTAAPWLVGEPTAEVPPEKLYEKLKPFEERVAADIERDQRSRADDQDESLAVICGAQLVARFVLEQ